MKPEDLQVILDTHNQYWGDKRDSLIRYKSVYEMDFWDTEKDAGLNQIRIQTNDGYGYIESFQASLFAKNPAVVVKSGVLGKGDTLSTQQPKRD
jgi:hypothetical protein